MVQESGFKFSAALNKFGFFLIGENSPYSEKKKVFIFIHNSCCGWILYLPLNPFLSPCIPLSLYQMDSTAPEENTDELLGTPTSQDLSSKNNNISVKFKQFLLSTFLFSLMTSL